MGQFWKGVGRLQIQVQRLQGNHTGRTAFGLGCLCILTKNELFLLEACQNKLARRPLALTGGNWESEPKKRDVSIKVLHRKLGIVPNAMEVRIRRLGWAQRMAQQIQKDDLCHRQVLGAILEQTRLDTFPYMTNEGKLTRQKQFRDEINSLKEFDEGDDFVRELDRDVRKVFSLYAEDFCAIELNVIRAKALEHNVATPGTVRELEEVPEKQTHNTWRCRCWTKDCEKCTEFF